MHEQLKLFIRSSHPLVAIETLDEDRACKIVRAVVEDVGYSLMEWTVTQGLKWMKPPEESAVDKTDKAALALAHIRDMADNEICYLFKDLAPHCNDAVVQRHLRDLSRRERATLILVDSVPLPDAIRRLAVPLPLELPGNEDLQKVLIETFNKIRKRSLYEVSSKLTQQDVDRMVQALRGLTSVEAARVVAVAIQDDFALTADDLPRMVEAKRSLLAGMGCLESVLPEVSVDEAGGLDNLKAWLAKRRRGMTKEAREFGIDPPRGILLLGVQGCGKSLCAKLVAADWNMPLLRMDPGVLYQKFVGESEYRLRQALAQAEAMAPAVLWIDEIEKAFASASTESADGGLSQRMFGTLLTWMQEHRNPIFMVATANNIAALPPELMRKGRFDEVFFIDLPVDAARRQIWEIQLRKRKRSSSAFNLNELVRATAGFSGAEIEQALISALYSAYTAGEDIRTDHLLADVKATKPLSTLMKEQVVRLRAWAQDRCVPAD